MLVEYIRYTLTRHAPAELLSAYGKARRFLDESPDCLGFELAQCAEDASVIVVRIQWTSADGHLVGFRQGPLFPPFLAEIRAFVHEISEMRHYRILLGEN